MQDHFVKFVSINIHTFSEKK